MLALFPETYFITTILNVKILIKYIEQALGYILVKINKKR